MAKLLCSLFLAGFVLQANAFSFLKPFDFIPSIPNPFSLFSGLFDFIPNPFKLISNIFSWVPNPFSKIGKNPCTLQYVIGNCNKSLTRYYYDIKEKACKKFTYSGCYGNENSFMSKKECEKRCKKD